VPGRLPVAGDLRGLPEGGENPGAEEGATDREAQVGQMTVGEGHLIPASARRIVGHGSETLEGCA